MKLKYVVLCFAYYYIFFFKLPTPTANVLKRKAQNLTVAVSSTFWQAVVCENFLLAIAGRGCRVTEVMMFKWQTGGAPCFIGSVKRTRLKSRSDDIHIYLLAKKCKYLLHIFF